MSSQLGSFEKVLRLGEGRRLKRLADQAAYIGTLEPELEALFDVQLMGGIALHEGDIAEMKTGEGKTFVAVQPLYLNALSGHGVHLVTVNDYLAKRDAEWTKPVWDALGMRVGHIENMMPFEA